MDFGRKGNGMKDTATVVDTLVGTSAINAMVTKSNRDKMPSEKLGRVLAALGVNPIGKDPRGFMLWSSIAVQAVIPGIRKVIEDEKSVIDKLSEPQKEEPKPAALPEYANLIADMDHRVSLIIGDIMEDTVEKVAQMHAGNQTIFKTLIEHDKKRKDEHDAVMQNLLDVTSGLAAIVAKLNEPVVDKKPAQAQIADPTSKEIPRVVEILESAIQGKKHRPHIGIIGITSPASSQIEKEFCDSFKISMLGPNEPHKIVNMRNCDRVFTLRGKVMSRHMNELKNIGQKPYSIGDSVSKIRDALTAYFIEVSEKEAA
jgi:hypothetical protein